MHKYLLLFAFILFSNESLAGNFIIEDRDNPGSTNIEANVVSGETGQVAIKISIPPGESGEITRGLGQSGLTLLDDCVRKYDDTEGLECILNVEIGASTTGRKRVQFLDKNRGRYLINVTVNRVASQEDVDRTLDPADYATSLEITPGTNIDFGNVTSGSVRKIVYVKNIGQFPTEPLAPSSLSNRVHYSIISNSCSSNELEVAETCGIILDFNSTGLFDGTVTSGFQIHPISDNSSPLDISLTAQVTGNPPPNISLDAAISKVDPTECLALNPANPTP